MLASLALWAQDGGLLALLRDSLVVAASLVAGAGVAVRALRALRRRDLSIEVLVTIATVGALAIGEYWEAAAVTFLFTLGHALEARTLRRTRAALGALLTLLPTSVRVLRQGVETEVVPHEVLRGEVVVVRPGERIPVDGRVVDGRAGVDESSLTGESMPADKEPGAQVFTGTVTHGYLEVKAEALGADSTLARLVQRVEEAQEAKPPRQQFLERFARLYTPAVVVASALAWGQTGDVHLALTLLVIACPGALVIASPVASVTGIGRGAKGGVLLKGGEALETLARVRTVAFDKTGTLTVGKPTVREVFTREFGTFSLTSSGSAPDSVRALLRLAATAEAGSEHPIAAAVREAAGEIPARRPGSFEAVVGKGARAELHGEELLVGSPVYLEGSGIVVGARAQQGLEELQARGRTVAGIARAGELLGWIGLDDEVRPHAAEAVEALRAIGVGRLVMLTGDNRRSGEAVAAELGLDEVHAQLFPVAKSDLVGRLAAADGPVAMVGDGVNDALALARADVGIAMGAAGSRAALETAGVALMGDDLRALPKAIELARRTVAVTRQNLAIALGTVGLLIVGVLAGEVHMAGGMLLHQASVLLVILNALRLSRQPRERSEAPRVGCVLAERGWCPAHQG